MIGEPQGIAECVASWLHYKSMTGLNDLLNESSMAVPIAEYLAAMHGQEVESEKAHPLFKTNQSGRPKQIDFVRVKNGEKTWHAAYEAKFQTQSFKLIISDLCRLLCLGQVDGIGNPSRYFIYAAKIEGSDAILTNSFNSGDKGRQLYYENILPGNTTNRKELAFKITNLHKKQMVEFHRFAKLNQVKLPSSIRIKLGGWFKSGRYVCAVWQIWASQGSVLLCHREIIT